MLVRLVSISVGAEWDRRWHVLRGRLVVGFEGDERLAIAFCILCKLALPWSDYRMMHHQHIRGPVSHCPICLLLIDIDHSGQRLVVRVCRAHGRQLMLSWLGLMLFLVAWSF